VRDARSY